MPDLYPKITVVTPSYNQAQFLEQTILSVIGQQYPNLEYIIMDGGSKDGSVAIIKKYEHHFAYWQSKQDNGQGAAINDGFARSTGDILCWLNSDDMYLPGTLLKIGRMFTEITEPTILFGNCLHFRENSSKARGSDVVGAQKELNLGLCDYIIQPSSFWNRGAWEKNGKLNESFHYTFDWEWFIRAEKNNVKFIPLKEYLSLYRIHEAHKSGAGGDKRSLELAEIYGLYKSQKMKLTFMQFNKYNNKYKLFHNIVYASNLHKIKFIQNTIRLLLFSSLSYEEYNNVTRM